MYCTCWHAHQRNVPVVVDSIGNISDFRAIDRVAQHRWEQGGDRERACELAFGAKPCMQLGHRVPSSIVCASSATVPLTHHRQAYTCTATHYVCLALLLACSVPGREVS